MKVFKHKIGLLYVAAILSGGSLLSSCTDAEDEMLLEMEIQANGQGDNPPPPPPPEPD